MDRVHLFVEDSLTWGDDGVLMGHPPTDLDKLKDRFRCVMGLLPLRKVFVLTKLLSCLLTAFYTEEVMVRDSFASNVLGDKRDEDLSKGEMWIKKEYSLLLNARTLSTCLVFLFMSNILAIFGLAVTEGSLPSYLHPIGRRISREFALYLVLVSILYSGWCVVLVHSYEWSQDQWHMHFLGKTVLFLIKVTADVWFVSIDVQTVRYMAFHNRAQRERELVVFNSMINKIQANTMVR